MPIARHQHHHAEGAKRGQHIGDQIEHRCAPGIGRTIAAAANNAREHAQQHEADLRDRRVGKHALEVGLCNGNQIAKDHRQHRQHQQHLLPVVGHTDQAAGQNPESDREGGELGARRNQEGGYGRGALIDIGHPHVKRHRTELEGQAGNDENHAEDQNFGAGRRKAAH